MKHVSGIIFVVLLCGGCGILSRKSADRVHPLSQNALIMQLIKSSKEDVLATAGTAVREDVDDNESGSFWIIPDSDTCDYSDKQIFNHFHDGWAGGRWIPWRLTSTSMSYTVFLCNRGEVPFPVTSEGIDLELEPVLFHGLEPRVIYRVSEDSVRVYSPSEFFRCNFEMGEDNHFHFLISSNPSSSERYWKIDFYYKDTSSYRENVLMWEREHKEWVVSTLRFLQLKDSDYYYSDAELKMRGEYFEKHLFNRGLAGESSPLFDLVPLSLDKREVREDLINPDRDVRLSLPSE